MFFEVNHLMGGVCIWTCTFLAAYFLRHANREKWIGKRAAVILTCLVLVLPIFLTAIEIFHWFLPPEFPPREVEGG
jgi:hypothetical protein